jgi:hypothetical protein
MNKKDIVESFKAFVAQQTKDMAAIKARAKKEAATAEAKMEAHYALLSKEVAAYNAEVEEHNAEIDKIAADLKSAFAEARADYMEIVKDTDGLTSVKPSVVKALEKYRDTADEKYLDDALTGLAKHRDEVVKAAGKSDKKAAKFAAEIDKMIKAGS